MQASYVNAKEAAAFLGLNEFTLYRWALLKKIPSYKINEKTRRFRLIDLEQWMSTKRVEARKSR